MARDVAAPDAADPLEDFFARDEEYQASEITYGEAQTDMAARGARGTVELLAFWVADEEYAVEITEIEEIIKIPLITEVPRCHPSVLGIISLRGTIVPVLDLRLILGLDRQDTTKASRILVLRGDGDPVGVLVDRVTSVVRLGRDTLEQTPKGMASAAQDLIRGVGRLGGRLLIILEVNAVLDVMVMAA